ncbi:MAG: ion channel [Candidatus Neomarinimicrobiota bacterium]|nr:ion channel [Candidatus Neomarinimicrobiota bacterium]MEC8689144.1 ion channel [Candidatus Neomarinimicrobiota bacterium]MEC8705577.1 ion channel [Candidatus Neomarinimicrobiota bacterium]|tara:strand:+ start:50 stop:1174 length:1125 start_codon:yes stop_codon:yes gene_type:complete
MQLWLKTLIRNSFFQVGIGLFITMIFGGIVLQWLETGDISKGDNPFWWAIVTMTTVGYGDFSPETPEGRVFAVFIMFAGITLVSLLTASISSIFVAQKIREGKGLEKLNISDHIVLCGWNSNTSNLMNSIQKLNHEKHLDLVLVNELSEEEVNQIKSRFTKLNILFVSGDYTQEETLLKASVTTSNTVIIIPNNINNEDGLHDEKTIFATLTIKSIDSSIRVVAYLLERENLTHIKRAEADEVVISDDFSLNILASHVVDPGVPQLSNHLVNADSSSRFVRKQIPSNFVGKQYGDLFDYFRGENGSLLVGLYYEDEHLGIGSILSSDTSSLDKFIEQKLKEGGISLQEQSKVHVNVNPKTDYIIKDGEKALLIP